MKTKHLFLVFSAILLITLLGTSIVGIGIDTPKCFFHNKHDCANSKYNCTYCEKGSYCSKFNECSVDNQGTNYNYIVLIVGCAIGCFFIGSIDAKHQFKRVLLHTEKVLLMGMLLMKLTVKFLPNDPLGPFEFTVTILFVTNYFQVYKTFFKPLYFLDSKEEKQILHDFSVADREEKAWKEAKENNNNDMVMDMRSHKDLLIDQCLQKFVKRLVFNIFLSVVAVFTEGVSQLANANFNYVIIICLGMMNLNIRYIGFARTYKSKVTRYAIVLISLGIIVSASVIGNRIYLYVLNVLSCITIFVDSISFEKQEYLF